MPTEVPQTLRLAAARNVAHEERQAGKSGILIAGENVPPEERQNVGLLGIPLNHIVAAHAALTVPDVLMLLSLALVDHGFARLEEASTCFHTILNGPTKCLLHFLGFRWLGLEVFWIRVLCPVGQFCSWPE